MPPVENAVPIYCTIAPVRRSTGVCPRLITAGRGVLHRFLAGGKVDLLIEPTFGEGHGYVVGIRGVAISELTRRIVVAEAVG